MTSSSGSSLNGDVVTWNVPTLAAQATISVQLTVTATQTVINQAYGASADGGYRAPWTQPVRTLIPLRQGFLPLLVKD